MNISTFILSIILIINIIHTYSGINSDTLFNYFNVVLSIINFTFICGLYDRHCHAKQDIESEDSIKEK